MIWYIRLKTQLSGDYTACVEATTEDEAHEKAMQQVRAKYLPNLAWANYEVLEPDPRETK